MVPRRTRAIETQGLVDSDRLRDAVEAIREAGAEGLTRDRLRQQLGVRSVRTVDRAIGLLEAQGARLDRIRRGTPPIIHFVLRKGPTWDEHVSSEARLALRIAGLSLTQTGTHLWQDKLDALEHLASQRMSNRDRRLFEHLKRAVRVQGAVDDPIETPNLLEPILTALDGAKEMQIEYQAAGAGTPTPYQVVPYALTHDLFSGGTFLLVWEPRRRLPLHLRLNRICAAKPTSRAGTYPADLMAQAADYQIGGWTSANPPFQVEAVIRGANWVQAFKEAPPALPRFEARPGPAEDAVLVRFWATHPKGVLRWLLQFGAMAEVLHPVEIREAVAGQLREALARYDAV
ncbi:helix-turn-helix transcriptional regulator [Mesoterricola sediminis]|uniref:WYL domain-containing protein n=1 Tax=Mesoterricola sediminis TaxID=2927980 RepID=A0AA48H457_9BACT|nr:WYL domain-containing protein [Mesoterricola sediminis]BDU77131.1 hypothetical protein METESE_20890 [Mesoterricola sediminis]